MKGFIYLLVALFNLAIILSLLNLTVAAPTSHDQVATNNHLKRSSYTDSFEAHDNGDDLGEDSIEYTELSPPDLQAYLYGRSLKKGFNAWAGRRQLDHLYKRLVEYNKQHEMTRQRRRPWGGSA